ncbi:MAG TPA: tetratricopeptide repeat protein [Flavipsychrobacter sp.]
MSKATGEKRFLIAFSFAGEKRDYVAQVAKKLADKFGEERILYDKYHEAEFAHPDLALDLPDFYKNDSVLIVTVFCKDYENKEWCGLEWRAIFSMVKERRGKEILLARFDYASERGLQGLEGFAELDKKTPDEFASLILERLALNEGNPKDYYTKTELKDKKVMRTTIPHNLPRLQPFFGREEELKRIAEALDPENRSWGALIDGAGGMGKTSLAVRAAYDISPEVFDRIVFTTLKSREMDDDGERYLDIFLVDSLTGLYNEMAREMGCDNIAKAPLEQKAHMLIDALRNTKTLLILDNLESLIKKDRDAIFNFVKRLPQGCKAILTSRGRIGPGAEELILEQLDEQAALDTLAELAEHNKVLAKTTVEERKSLYRQTAGKPLLIRWTAGQLGRGHCLTISDAIDFLQSCPPKNDPLEFIFGDLVEEFTLEETKILCSLTYFTQPAKPEHIANIAECTKEETDRALRSLANRSLVVPSEERSTYNLVPLVAGFLLRKRPEVIAETGSVLEKYAYVMVVENGYTHYERFSILDAEWIAVAAALSRFLCGPNTILQKVCDALYDFLQYTGRWDEGLRLSLDAEKRAVEAEDYYYAGWRVYQAGYVYYPRGQAAEILTCAERATIYWQKAVAGPREHAVALQLQGVGYELLENYSAAIESYQKAYEVLKGVDQEMNLIASILNDLASAKDGTGNFEGADHNQREALRIAKAANNFSSVVLYTGNLAYRALDMGKLEDAEKLLREVLPLSEKLGRLELIGYNCYRLAEVLQKRRKNKEALTYAKRAVNLYARLGSPNLIDALKTLKQCVERDEE